MQILSLLGAVLILSAAGLAQAQPVARKNGEQVYRETCMACHGPGLAGAPRVGDAKVWEKLRKEGPHVVTAHGWVGVRGMPAQGGRPELTLQEFADAVAWMARASSTHWPDADEAQLARIRAEEKKRREQLARKARGH